MDELRDFPSATEPRAEEREQFVVDNDRKADWAMRKLAAIRSKIAENDEIANAEIERIKQWIERVNGAFDSDIAYFETQLRNYAEQQRTEGRKTIDLAYGKIKSRQVAAKIRVESVPDFLKWAKENAPSLVRFKEEPNQTEINSALEITQDGFVVTKEGELVPAVTVEAERLSISIETE